MKIKGYKKINISSWEDESVIGVWRKILPKHEPRCHSHGNDRVMITIREKLLGQAKVKYFEITLAGQYQTNWYKFQSTGIKPKDLSKNLEDIEVNLIRCWRVIHDAELNKDTT